MAPNNPKTPARTIRVPDDLWAAATAVANKRNESLSDVMRRSLRRYVNRYSRQDGGESR